MCALLETRKGTAFPDPAQGERREQEAHSGYLAQVHKGQVLYRYPIPYPWPVNNSDSGMAVTCSPRRDSPLPVSSAS